MADAAVTTAEVEELRHHLGFGNVGLGGYPYTPDGYLQLFTQVIQPYLGTAPETTATTAVTASTIATVTPASMTGIAVGVRLHVDNGSDWEEVLVKAVTVSTFTARFEKAHTTAGYPILVSSGIARLRVLLQAASGAWAAIQSPDAVAGAGLRRVDEIEWYPGLGTLGGAQAQYRAIVGMLGSLVRVDPVDTAGRGAGGRVEVY